MRKSIAVLCGAAVLGFAGQGIAQTTTPSTTPSTMTPSTTAPASSTTMSQKEMRMKGMDTNGDGMVSEKEFNDYHKGMWGKMKRNAAGMAMISDVESMYGPGVVPSAIPGEKAMKAKP